MLKLKLNAQEDLLLNGAKEPDTWGVVNHLFSKLEYTRVAAAAERFSNKERPAFVAQLLSFNPTLPLLLLYLEALKSANHRGAEDALSEALGVIDFREVTEGQMRRVIDLIGEIVAHSEQAPLLLQLLESKSFREAIDGALDKLPESLRQMVSPLRAVSSVVFHGKKNPVAASHLQRGINLLLTAQTRLMHGAPVTAIVRLLEHSLALGALDNAAVRRQVESLLSKLPDLAERSRLRIGYARALMSASAFSAAGAVVDGLVAETKSAASSRGRPAKVSAMAQRRDARDNRSTYPEESTVALWARALRAPREHGIAAIKSGLYLPTKSELPLVPGFCLQTQRPVWIRRFKEDSSSEVMDQVLTCAERHRTGAPGLTPEYYRSGDAPGDFVCYLAGDTNLSRLPPDLSLGELAAIARQLFSALKGLEQLGLGYSALPARSFEVSGGRVQLLESWDAQPLQGDKGDCQAVALVKQWLTLRASSHTTLAARLDNNSRFQSVQAAPQLLAAITALERTTGTTEGEAGRAR